MTTINPSSSAINQMTATSQVRSVQPTQQTQSTAAPNAASGLYSKLKNVGDKFLDGLKAIKQAIGNAFDGFKGAFKSALGQVHKQIAKGVEQMNTSLPQPVRQAQAELVQSLRPLDPKDKRDLLAVMANSKTREAFSAFAAKEFSSENIDSFQALKKLASDPHLTLDKLRQFDAEFIAVKAPREINIDNTNIRQPFEQALNNNDLAGALRAMKETMVKGMVTNLSDTYARFSLTQP